MPVVRDMVGILEEIRELHYDVTLAIDIIFVNRIPFFLVISQNLYFMTVTHLKDCTQGTIEKEFGEMCGYYIMQKEGFQVSSVMADGEFAPLAGLMNTFPDAPKLNLVASASKHEPIVEQCIRVIRNVRGLFGTPYHSRPYQKVAEAHDLLRGQAH